MILHVDMADILSSCKKLNSEKMGENIDSKGLILCKIPLYLAL